jgi:curli production assembly/transport component CsgF
MKASAVIYFLLGAQVGVCSEQVYHPINPSFGGSSMNSSHLLAIASAQNGYKDKSSSSSSSSSTSGTTTSLGALFASQLQSRLMSALADQVTTAIFGANPANSGTITFGTQTITFSRGLEAVNIDIFDAATNTTTHVSVPTLQVN